MNQIEINKIDKEIGIGYEWKIWLQDEDGIQEDSIVLTPSQMKELKEKISKLEI